MVTPLRLEVEAREDAKLLPRGRGDLARQLLLWSGFALAYELIRALAKPEAQSALANARTVLHVERWLHLFFERPLQRAVLGVDELVTAVSWTYWLSQFAVVVTALLWIYLRRNDFYARVRNAFIVTNTLGLCGYILLPCAPPRLLPGLIEDTLAASATLNHGHGLVNLAENPYAAMPSLHAADALLIGVALATLVRPPWLKALWLFWPAWVAFALIVTGNHFWIDIAAGMLLVALAVPLSRLRLRRTEIGRSADATAGVAHP